MSTLANRAWSRTLALAKASGEDNHRIWTGSKGLFAHSTRTHPLPVFIVLHLHTATNIVFTVFVFLIIVVFVGVFTQVPNSCPNKFQQDFP